MKQPETTTSGVATLFPLVDATRAGELLFASLHGVATMSRQLQQHMPLPDRLQKLLESKFSGILKQLFGTNEIPLLWRELPLRKTHLVEAGLRVAAAASPPVYPSDRTAGAEKLSGRGDGSDLAGRRILCVGGRAALYPEYRHVVETAGGSLLIYRGDQQHDPDCLPALLACADALLCPVDCINHETYFTAKCYCKYSGKPCAVLARSDLPTFRKGVAVLAAAATTTPEIPLPNQRQAGYVTN